MSFSRANEHHWKRRLLLVLALLFTVCSLLWAPAYGQADNTPARLDALSKYVDSIDHDLDTGDAPSVEQLKTWADRLATERSLASGCVADGEKNLARIKADAEGLGAAVPGEGADVVRKRKEVSKLIADQERALTECRVLLLRIDELTERTGLLYKAVVAAQLFARGPSLLVLALDNWVNAPSYGAATFSFIREHAGLKNLTTGEWIWLALLALAAFAIGLRIRRQAPQAPAPETADHTSRGSYSGSLAAAFRHYAPRLLAATTVAFYVYVLTGDIRPVPFINVVLYGMPAYLLTFVFIRFLFTPGPPYQRPIAVSDEFGRRMARRLRVLALLGYIGYLLFSTLLAQHIPEEAYLFVRGLYAALLFVNVAWALWLVARLREKDEFRWVGYLIALVLIVSLGAEWAGYRNLALTIVRVIGGSLVAFGTTILLGRLFSEAYDALEHGEGSWPRRLRSLLGVGTGKPVPGLTWMRLATYLMLWSLFGYAALRIWHVPSSTIRQVEDILVDGFILGQFQVVPLRVLLAIAIFALLITAARWAQTRMDQHWLRYARIDHGAREAIVTITGYVLVVISALIGLGIAGFEFRNVAIIAGALSVGIGFGLQNIVNNFVSGLILLFERPVKTGDWVVVGSTEGYVKRIRIRSTQIQTFDRADVIVPNSELISQQVTNWMLYNAQGRVRVPVGVAYGSDTKKVKSILERVGRDHPSVITDGSYPDPQVLFLGFGDSSLNFELRCFIRNVDNRLQVRSDLNFAIDDAFRTEGIEIPFPQRDLHLRSLPPDMRREVPDPPEP